MSQPTEHGPRVGDSYPNSILHSPNPYSGVRMIPTKHWELSSPMHWAPVEIA